jgi:hypothetical protein
LSLSFSSRAAKQGTGVPNIIPPPTLKVRE